MDKDAEESQSDFHYTPSLDLISASGVRFRMRMLRLLSALLRGTASNLENLLRDFATLEFEVQTG